MDPCCTSTKDEGTAAEIEDDFALLIADIAGLILKQEIDVVVVLPKVDWGLITLQKRST